MNNSLTPRYLIILVILGWSFYTLWPTIKHQNLTDDEKELLREEGKLNRIESQIIRQGLDLKGGMYIELEADIPTLVKNLASNRNEKFDAALIASIEVSSTFMIIPSLLSFLSNSLLEISSFSLYNTLSSLL